jgi:multiple sugar transport system ATP-binding protein
MFVAGFIGEPPMNFIRCTVKKGCVRIGGELLDLGEKLGGKSAQYEGKELVFGFRPEAVRLGEQPNAFALHAMVELTEMLGDNTNVYIKMGDEQAILKVDPHDTPDTDAPVTFSVPFESVYLFDAETEKVIE